MRYDPIPSEQLHSAWEYVKAGLLRTLEVSPERWLPEDVFTHLRIKRAKLYIGHDEQQRRGFFITEPRVDPFSSEPILGVWVLYAEPTVGKHCADVDEFVEETMTYIDGLAREAGATLIAMEGRKGWERYLREYFTPVRVRYERRIKP